MPLKSFVKVSHVSNLSDARYCAGMGVEMLGFSTVAGAPQYVTPQVFQDIRGWVSGPSITAEIYGIASASVIDSVIRDYAPDYLELSMDEYERFSDALTLPCIISVADVSQLKSHKKMPGVAFVIVADGTGCDAIASIDYPVLIKVTSAEGLHPLLAENCYRGFVLEAPAETRPGYTNYDALGNILEALEEDV